MSEESLRNTLLQVNATIIVGLLIFLTISPLVFNNTPTQANDLQQRLTILRNTQILFYITYLVIVPCILAPIVPNVVTSRTFKWNYYFCNYF